MYKIVLQLCFLFFGKDSCPCYAVFPLELCVSLRAPYKQSQNLCVWVCTWPTKLILRALFLSLHSFSLCPFALFIDVEHRRLYWCIIVVAHLKFKKWLKEIAWGWITTALMSVNVKLKSLLQYSTGYVSND